MRQEKKNSALDDESRIIEFETGLTESKARERRLLAALFKEVPPGSPGFARLSARPLVVECAGDAFAALFSGRATADAFDDGEWEAAGAVLSNASDELRRKESLGLAELMILKSFSERLTEDAKFPGAAAHALGAMVSVAVASSRVLRSSDRNFWFDAIPGVLFSGLHKCVRSFRSVRGAKDAAAAMLEKLTVLFSRSKIPASKSAKIIERLNLFDAVLFRKTTAPKGEILFEEDVVSALSESETIKESHLTAQNDAEVLLELSDAVELMDEHERKTFLDLFLFELKYSGFLVRDGLVGSEELVSALERLHESIGADPFRKQGVSFDEYGWNIHAGGERPTTQENAGRENSEALFAGLARELETSENIKKTLSVHDRFFSLAQIRDISSAAGGAEYARAAATAAAGIRAWSSEEREGWDEPSL